MREAILARVASLPPMPATAARLARRLGDPEVPLAELVEEIRYDPGLTATMLRLANSVAFGLPRAVRSAQEALVRLGTKRVFQLAVASTFREVLGAAVNGYALPPGELWRHAVAVALVSERLALQGGGVPLEVAFTAGLLHDVGKIVLGSFVAGEFPALEEMQGEGFDLAEQEVLGVDHAEAGAEIMTRWDLPSELVETARYHHRPDAAEQWLLLVDVVHVADAVCLMQGIGAGRDGLHYVPSRKAVARLGLTVGKVEVLVSEVLGGLSALEELLQPTNGGH